MSDADFHYAVTGRWPFPADMLRRDDAKPATPADAELVERLSGEFAPDGTDFLATHTVNLVMPEAARRRPNTARWESFDWQVPGDEFHQLRKAERAREARLEKDAAAALAKLDQKDVEALRWLFARQASH